MMMMILVGNRYTERTSLWFKFSWASRKICLLWSKPPCGLHLLHPKLSWADNGVPCVVSVTLSFYTLPPSPQITLTSDNTSPQITLTSFFNTHLLNFISFSVGKYIFLSKLLSTSNFILKTPCSTVSRGLAFCGLKILGDLKNLAHESFGFQNAWFREVLTYLFRNSIDFCLLSCMCPSSKGWKSLNWEVEIGAVTTTYRRKKTIIFSPKLYPTTKGKKQSIKHLVPKKNLVYLLPTFCSNS